MSKKNFNPFNKHFDAHESDEDIDRPQKKICKFCGKRNLNWEDDSGKWILYDAKTGEVHKCKSKQPTDVNKLMNSKL